MAQGGFNPYFDLGFTLQDTATIPDLLSLIPHSPDGHLLHSCGLGGDSVPSLPEKIESLWPRLLWVCWSSHSTPHYCSRRALLGLGLYPSLFATHLPSFLASILFHVALSLTPINSLSSPSSSKVLTFLPPSSFHQFPLMFAAKLCPLLGSALWHIRLRCHLQGPVRCHSG